MISELLLVYPEMFMHRSFGRRLGAATLALAATAAFAGTADAALVSRSAEVNADNNYPVWYEDDAGLRLQQCTDTTALCTLIPGELTGQPNDPEFFWSAAEALIDDGVRTAELVLDLEAAQDAAPFINFGRYQILMDGFDGNTTYKVTTPIGTKTFTTDAVGSIARFRDEIGCDADPCDFDAALGSSIGPFLRWDPAVAPAAPAGYIGDPAVPHEIVGSPTGDNVFRIEGPNAGGPGVNVLETKLFTVMGKIADGAPAPVASSDTWGPRALSFAAREAGTTSASQSIGVQNTGFASLPVGAPTITGPGAADYQAVNGCPLAPASLGQPATGAGSRCSIAVTFTPSAAGARPATLTFTTGSANGDNSVATRTTRSVTLNGTGIVTPPAQQQTTTTSTAAATQTQPSVTPRVTPLAVTLSRIGVPSALKLKSAKARGLTLRLSGSGVSRVLVRIKRGSRTVYSKTVSTGNQVKLNARALRRLLRTGTYTVQLTPIAASGQRGVTVTRRLKISR